MNPAREAWRRLVESAAESLRMAALPECRFEPVASVRVDGDCVVVPEAAVAHLLAYDVFPVAAARQLAFTLKRLELSRRGVAFDASAEADASAFAEAFVRDHVLNG